jgi:hypothetical protein
MKVTNLIVQLGNKLSNLFYYELIINIDYKLNNCIYKKLIGGNDRFFKSIDIL